MSTIALERPLTRADAERAANILMKHPVVERIWVFGSVARGEAAPRDLDLVLESHPVFADAFGAYASGQLSVEDVGGTADQLPPPGSRPRAALDALGKEAYELYREATLAVAGRPIDLMVLPRDWHNSFAAAKGVFPDDEPAAVAKLFDEAVLLYERSATIDDDLLHF